MVVLGVAVDAVGQIAVQHDTGACVEGAAQVDHAAVAVDVQHGVFQHGLQLRQAGLAQQAHIDALYGQIIPLLAQLHQLDLGKALMADAAQRGVVRVGPLLGGVLGAAGGVNALLQGEIGAVGQPEFCQCFRLLLHRNGEAEVIGDAQRAVDVRHLQAVLASGHGEGVDAGVEHIGIGGEEMPRALTVREIHPLLHQRRQLAGVVCGGQRRLVAAEHLREPVELHGQIVFSGDKSAPRTVVGCKVLLTVDGKARLLRKGEYGDLQTVGKAVEEILDEVHLHQIGAQTAVETECHAGLFTGHARTSSLMMLSAASMTISGVMEAMQGGVS